MEEEIKDAKKIMPVVTYFILIVTFFIQFYISLIPQSEALKIFDKYSLLPIHLFQGIDVESIITYMFLHGSLSHLLVNSIALYGAGIIVEKDIGHLKFFIVFMISGIVAGFMHSFLNPSSDVPLVGSSGGVFGIISVLFLLMPFKITFALIIPMPSVIVGLLLSAFELIALWLSTDIGIAHDAHISGFIMGGISAFVIDQKRAIKGLFIAILILALLYYVASYFDIIPSMFGV